MANIMRWRYGVTNPVTLLVDLATDIEVGDLLWLDDDDLKPASTAFEFGSKLPLDFYKVQRKFRDSFIGVAMSRSRVGCLQPVRVATSGVFEFEVVEACFELGDRVAVAAVGCSCMLADQMVVGVNYDGAGLWIGLVAKRTIGCVDRVLVEIRSTVMDVG